MSAVDRSLETRIEVLADSVGSRIDGAPEPFTDEGVAWAAWVREEVRAIAEDHRATWPAPAPAAGELYGASRS